MSKVAMIAAGFIMLLGSIGWAVHGAAPALSMETLYFEISADGPKHPPSLHELPPAVGFCSMFGFGVAALCVALAVGDKNRCVSTKGFSMLLISGLIVFLSFAISLGVISSLNRTFMKIAQSPVAPKAEELQTTVESAGAMLQYCAFAIIPASLLVIAAALLGTQQAGSRKSTVARKLIAALGVAIACVVAICVYRVASSSSDLASLMGGPTIRPSTLAEQIITILGSTRLLFLSLLASAVLFVVSAKLTHGSSKSISPNEGD